MNNDKYAVQKNYYTCTCMSKEQFLLRANNSEGILCRQHKIFKISIFIICKDKFTFHYILDLTFRDI